MLNGKDTIVAVEQTVGRRNASVLLLLSLVPFTRADEFVKMSVGALGDDTSAAGRAAAELMGIEDPSTAAKEKKLRMKTARQLKEMLAEFGTQIHDGASKEEVQQLAREQDIITKWEARHPKRRAETPEELAAKATKLVWPLMDSDGDGHVRRDEMDAMGAGVAKNVDGMGRMPPGSFDIIDADASGGVTEEELLAYFTKVTHSRSYEAREGSEGQPSPYH